MRVNPYIHPSVLDIHSLLHSEPFPPDPYYQQDGPLPLLEETHAGDDVAVYARGPMSHLFSGLHEQNYITHAMLYATCVGPTQELCTDDRGPPAQPCGAQRPLSVIYGAALAIIVQKLIF